MRKWSSAAALAATLGAAAIGMAMASQGAVPAAPATPAAPGARDEIRRAIEAGNAQWIDGFRRADAAPVALSFSEDAVNVGKDGTVDRGRDAIAARMRDYLKTTGAATSARVDIGDFVVDGDLVYEWGRSDARFSGKTGGPDRRVGRYLTCWKRQPDGGWKIFRNLSLPE